MESDWLKGKNILLGVTGSIAAYKAVSLLRSLIKAGAQVTVVMTASAQRFVTPLTFEALSGRKVPSDLFSADQPMKHLSLAEEADLIVIVPATSNIIGKIANGVADDLLTTVVSATRSPVVICPAMDGYMWEHPVLVRNVSTMEGLGYSIITPEEGVLASGKTGIGRLASEASILAGIRRRLESRKDFSGEVILITAGPTREPMDPVRFISNRSSGKMGYALARAALNRGARVILVTGPTFLAAPAQAEVFRVETSQEMRECVLRLAHGCSIVVMAAAVSDYRPKTQAAEKIKKDAPSLTVELERTEDILQELSLGRATGGPKTLLVGFSAETGQLIEHAGAKLENKRLDLIVANDVTIEGSGFDGDTNIVTILDRAGFSESLPKLPKAEVAERILNRILALGTGTGAKSQAGTRVRSDVGG